MTLLRLRSSQSVGLRRLAALPAWVILAATVTYPLNLSVGRGVLAFLACLLILAVANNTVVFTCSVIGGLAVTSVLLSLPARFGLGWDEGSAIAMVFVLSTLGLTALVRQKVIATCYSTEAPTLNAYLLAIPVMIVSLLLNTISRSTPAQQLAMLAPEDNASWIHAASGFVRFGSTATNVSDQNYGLNGAGSYFVSLVSELTTGGMAKPPSYLAVSVVWNSYFITLFLLMFSTASVVLLAGAQIRRTRQANNAFLVPAAAAGASLIAVLLVSPHIQKAGHFTLVLSAAFVLGFFLLLYVLDDPTLGSSEETKSMTAALRRLALVVLLCSSSAAASIWFPLVPVMIVVSVHLLLKHFQRSRHSPNWVHHVGELAIVLVVLLASTRLVRIPIGDFSPSDLVNAEGGVIRPSTPILATGLLGLLILTVRLGSVTRTTGMKRLSSITEMPSRQTLVSALVLVFILLWAYSMVEFPKFPGYSTIKFGVLLYLIGFPLVFALLALLDNSRIVRSAPVTLIASATFCASLAIGGPNEMMRRDTAVEFQNSWMGSLLVASDRQPDALILCFSRPDELAFEGYLCTRFAAALQFKERQPLARLWRFQLLDNRVVDADTTEGSLTCGTKPWEQPYCIDKRVVEYLESGRSITVLMFPKDDQWWNSPNPFDDYPWAANLPWAEIRVVEGGIR